MKKAINQSTLTLILSGVSVLALLLMLFSMISYSNVTQQLNEANEERYELTYNANRFMNGSSYLTEEVRAFAATCDQEHYDNYLNEVNVLKNRDQGVAAMQEIGITTAEQGMIDQMAALSNQLVPLEEEAMKEAQEGQREAALTYVYGEDYGKAIAQIKDLKEQFLSALDSRSLAKVEQLQKETNSIQLRMFFAMALVAGCCWWWPSPGRALSARCWW